MPDLASYLSAIGRGPIPTMQPMAQPDLRSFLASRQLAPQPAAPAAPQASMQELQSALTQNLGGTPVGMAAPPLVPPSIQAETELAAKADSAKKQEAMALFLSQLPQAGAGIGRYLDQIFSKKATPQVKR